MPESDKVFAGSIPENYDHYMVPLIFQPYAEDIARRVAARSPKRVLETAAGSGVVTRAVAAILAADATYTATDLNPPMLDYAKSRQADDTRIRWRQADAQVLPFDDAAFDVVCCQFGAMFFPDKSKAFSQVRRVLKPGGVLLFNVWDRIEENEIADVVTIALASRFPHDPPRFLARTPHGYHDVALVERDLRAGGFVSTDIHTIAARSRADSPRIPAVAYCQGTPLRNEIEARDPSGVDAATDIATAAIARRFGSGSVDGKIQAHVIVVER